MSEKDLQNRIQAAFNFQNAILFRNNCGSLKNKFGGWVTYGIGNPGGSDLIGISEVLITEKHIGQKLGVFTAIECKFGNNIASPEQIEFIKRIRKFGGIAAVAYTLEDALEVLRAKRGDELCALL